MNQKRLAGSKLQCIFGSSLPIAPFAMDDTCSKNHRFLHLSTSSLLTSHYGRLITPNLSDRPIADTPLAARMRLLQPEGNIHGIQALLLSASTSRDITASISPSCSKQTRRLMQFLPARSHQKTKITMVEIQNMPSNVILEKTQVGLPHVLCEGGLEVGEDWVTKIK